MKGYVHVHKFSIFISNFLQYHMFIFLIVIDVANIYYILKLGEALEFFF